MTGRTWHRYREGFEGQSCEWGVSPRRTDLLQFRFFSLHTERIKEVSLLSETIVFTKRRLRKYLFKGLHGPKRLVPNYE